MPNKIYSTKENAVEKWSDKCGFTSKTQKSGNWRGKSLISISLLLPDEYIEALDKLVEEGYYPNRNEAIRLAIRDLFKGKNYLSMDGLTGCDNWEKCVFNPDFAGTCRATMEDCFVMMLYHCFTIETGDSEVYEEDKHFLEMWNRWKKEYHDKKH